MKKTDYKIKWEPIKDKKDWQRRPFEKPVYWEAFILYRNRGRGNRSNCFKEMAKQVDHRGSQFHKWRIEWQWDARCEVWDDEQDAKVEDLNFDKVERTQKLLFNAADAFVEVAKLAAHGWLVTMLEWSEERATLPTREERLEMKPPISPYQAAQLAETGQKIRNLGQHRPTEILGVMDVSELQNEARKVMESSATVPKVNQLIDELINTCNDAKLNVEATLKEVPEREPA